MSSSGCGLPSNTCTLNQKLKVSSESDEISVIVFSFKKRPSHQLYVVQRLALVCFTFYSEMLIKWEHIATAAPSRTFWLGSAMHAHLIIQAQPAEVILFSPRHTLLPLNVLGNLAQKILQASSLLFSFLNKGAKTWRRRQTQTEGERQGGECWKWQKI